MPTVFLSYRKADAGKEAGRLSDSFRQKVGKRWVFRDLVDIGPGAKFDTVLDRELAASRVVLVLIGPGWAGELARRLEQPDIDYVRVEVAQALATGKRVIPVLVEDATLPRSEQLPEDLRELVTRQTTRLHDASWSEDVDRLIDAIGRPYRWGRLFVRAAAVTLAILLGVRYLIPELVPDRIGDFALMRAMVGALMGVYGLVEVYVGFLHHRRIHGA